MVKSIFEIERRIDISKEYHKMIYVLYDKEAVEYEDEYGYTNCCDFFTGIDKTIFLYWKHRETTLSIIEYMDESGFGIGKKYPGDKIYETDFLYFIELLLNMMALLDERKELKLRKRTKAVLLNIPLILEYLNYKCEEIDDKIIISKRDADIDSILEIVPNNIADNLLMYNDFKIKEDIEAKKKILKNLDLYIEKYQKVLKQFDSKLIDSIGMIMNKMGVNHPLKEEPFASYSENKLLEWYDKCFKMMIHAIRSLEINEIKKDREKLIKK